MKLLIPPLTLVYEWISNSPHTLPGNYLFMLELKLNPVSKRGHSSICTKGVSIMLRLFQSYWNHSKYIGNIDLVNYIKDMKLSPDKFGPLPSVNSINHSKSIAEFFELKLINDAANCFLTWTGVLKKTAE